MYMNTHIQGSSLHIYIIRYGILAKGEAQWSYSSRYIPVQAQLKSVPR